MTGVREGRHDTLQDERLKQALRKGVCDRDKGSDDRGNAWEHKKCITGLIIAGTILT